MCGEKLSIKCHNLKGEAILDRVHPQCCNILSLSIHQLVSSIIFDYRFCLFNAHSVKSSSKPSTCRPSWSRGNVLALRSKVRGFKSGWGRWIFSGRKNPEHKSSGRDFKLEVTSPSFRLVKESQAWKIALWAKFNRHIHVLLIPKFEGAQ